MSKIIRFIIKFLVRFFPTKKEKNLKGAWQELFRIHEEFTNLTAFLGQISYRPTPEERVYIERAEFNLISIRDELRIRLEEIKIQRLREFYDKRKQNK